MSLKDVDFTKLIFGLVLLIIAVPFVWLGRAQRLQADATEQLPLLTASRLAQSEPGQRAALEGFIAERNPIHFRKFVAYRWELYQGQRCTEDDEGSEDCEEIWIEQEKIYPRLWIDVSDGRVRWADSDYYFYSAGAAWQSDPNLVEGETHRYEGFEIGNPIFVVGDTAQDADGPAFQAEFVAAGHQSDYLSQERRMGGLFFWLGLGLGLIGLGFLGWYVKNTTADG